MDAVRTTYSTLDSAGSGSRSYNGKGGNIGSYGASKGVGCGAGSFYEDGKNKIGIYNGSYNGISFLNILKGSNIGNPYYMNVGGLAGFGGGSHGGTNYSLDLVWGGGSGSGFSGGCGGSAGYFQGQTYGGSAGGSYDINGIQNFATIMISEGIAGYNDDNGYVKIRLLTPYDFLYYANANKNIITNGLTFLIEPANNISYNSDITSTSITNLVDASYAFLEGSYSYITADKSIRLFNNTFSSSTLNTSYIRINTHDSNIKTVSIWYKLLTTPIDNSFFMDTYNGYGHIIDNSIGADWNDAINDMESGGEMYLNSCNIGIPINWNNLTSSLNNWNNISLISYSNISNDIVLFNSRDANGGVNVEFGPILIYDRVIALNEHLNNFYSYANSYYNPYNYYYNGVLQYFTVPENTHRIFVKAWSSGGGTGNYGGLSGSAPGGSGAFMSCYINVIPNDRLVIVVPNGGFKGSQFSRSMSGFMNNATGGYQSAGAGGLCAIYRELTNEYLIVAASGSGAGAFLGTYDLINTIDYTTAYTAGMPGGGLNGLPSISPESGTPATQTTGGIASLTYYNNTTVGENGSHLQGASGGINFGGASGSAWYTGAGGTDKQYFISGGSSGSSYYNPTYCSDVTIITGTPGINAASIPNSIDPDYPGQGIAKGGEIDQNGGNGFITIKLVY